MPVTASPPSRRRRPLTLLQPAARPVTIGMLGTYAPTQCGLATLWVALTEALGDVGVVRVVDRQPASDLARVSVAAS